MNPDLGNRAETGGPFLIFAEIERGADTEFADGRDIRFGQAAEMVGPKDLPPTRDARRGWDIRLDP
ncbi:hypothetical protein BRADO3392 [Bradyrhizobium sp. ORS 278]|nr:hypothetical protein BRADO3392 [Bradyrhizobium sp. ORS 278]